jgi:hypothetical protein
MTKIINAFHPDYIQTYHPEFLTAIRTESSQHAHGVINGGKSRVKRESVHGKNVDSIDRFPKTQPVSRTMEEKKRKLLAVTEFHMFSKAGAANVTPKGRREKKEQVQT